MTTLPQNEPGRGNPSGSPLDGSPVDPGSADRSETRASARELGEQAEAVGKAKVEEMRGTAAENLEKLAGSAQAAAATLQQDDVGHLSSYVSELADNMLRLSSSLRDKSGDELLREVGQLARSNPALFVTGSVAIGFGLARFARASQRHATADATTADATMAEGAYWTQPGWTGGAYTGATGDVGIGTTDSAMDSSNPLHPGVGQTGTSSDPQGGIH